MFVNQRREHLLHPDCQPLQVLPHLRRWQVAAIGEQPNRRLRNPESFSDFCRVSGPLVSSVVGVVVARVSGEPAKLSA